MKEGHLEIFSRLLSKKASITYFDKSVFQKIKQTKSSVDAYSVYFKYIIQIHLFVYR